MEDKKNKYFKVINKFPKKRITLNDEYLRIYQEHYIANRGGSGLAHFISQKMESWMHKKVSGRKGKDILELGAGNLNHLKFEKSFVNYDIIEPFKDLYQNNSQIKKIRNIFVSTSDVTHKYDKIISIATLEHLINLPKKLNYVKVYLNKMEYFKLQFHAKENLHLNLDGF